MNISLTPELEEYINGKVSSGLYTSASEVVRESLRLLYTQEHAQARREQQLNQAIEFGLEQLDKGEKILASESYDRLKGKIDQIK